MYWIAQHIGEDVDGRTGTLPDTHPCVQWWKKNSTVLKDKTEVAHWLNSMMEKWGDQEFCPSALHDEDYHTTIETQKSEFQETMEWVFLDENFTHIEKSTLYDMYLVKSTQNGNKHPKQAKNFHADVAVWLDKNPVLIGAIPCQLKKVNIKRGEALSDTSAEVYCNGKRVERNNNYYLSYDDYGRMKSWAERDVPTQKRGKIVSYD